MRNPIIDAQIIQRLNAINREFYEMTALEFDQTRGQAWIGWNEILPHIPAADPLSVLDVGCGNGRFGVFLSENLNCRIDYHGVDNNPALLSYASTALSSRDNLSATLEQRDIIEAPLMTGDYDLVVAFGVIHHVPNYDNRQMFVRQLGQCLKSGGMLAFACWRFYEIERLRDRIVAWSDELADKVEKHDYLLDWRRGEHALRYCHYVDDAENEALVSAIGLNLVAQVRADGAGGTANYYSLLKK
jgi:SAM-dependent methyltransferase